MESLIMYIARTHCRVVKPISQTLFLVTIDTLQAQFFWVQFLSSPVQQFLPLKSAWTWCPKGSYMLWEYLTYWILFLISLGLENDRTVLLSIKPCPGWLPVCGNRADMSVCYLGTHQSGEQNVFINTLENYGAGSKAHLFATSWFISCLRELECTHCSLLPTGSWTQTGWIHIRALSHSSTLEVILPPSASLLLLYTLGIILRPV